MIAGELPSKLSMVVSDWFAWTPGRETRRDWHAWAGQEAILPDADAPMPVLPMMLRRRATPIGQRALSAALACKSVQDARYVLASRHGEFDRTVVLLTSLAEKETSSPAEFSMSVHHGLAGLLSIHTGNRQGHTAIAATRDSFGYGLIEAAACLHEAPETPVLFLYFDAPLPDSYAAFRTDAERNLPLVVALTLTADGANSIELECVPAPGDVVQDSLAEAFLKFLLSGKDTAQGVGECKLWRWHRAA
jgi:hypothetical protein